MLTNKSELKKKLKKSKQSIAALQRKLRMLVIEKVGGEKLKKMTKKKETKENEDDKWERADHFTNIVTRSGK